VSALAGTLAGATLLVIGAFHIWWVRSPWPCATREDLARNVVGRPEGDLPPVFAPLSILVGSLLGVAAHLVAAKADVIPAGLPDPLVSVGAWCVAGVLVVRGAAGLVQSRLELGDAPARYRTLDVRVYSPLCLALAALIVVVIVSAN
jgi:hypothetical protein